MSGLKMIAVFAHLALITLMILPVVSKQLTFWWLDNLINLQLQWSVLAVLLLLFSIKYIQRFIIPLSFFYCAIITYNFFPLYKNEPRSQGYGETLNIAQLNIKYKNPNIDDLILKIAKSNYNIILLQEIDNDKHHKIEKLLKHYPYSVGTIFSEKYPLTIALFSQWPIVNRKIHDLGYVEGKIIEVIIQSPEKTVPIHIFALHPAAPRNQVLWQLRNETLDFVAHQIAASLLPYKIVIGDINTSPWSPAFKHLQKTAALQNSADGFGYIPSWAHSNLNKVMRVASSAYIDHCLVSNAFNIQNKTYQYIKGSDHVLISTELDLK